MHQQEVARIFLLANLLAHTRCHRDSRNTCGTDQRVNLTLCKEVHQLTKQNTAGRAKAERQQAENDNTDGLGAQENFALCCCANGDAKENRDDVHQLVLCRIGNTIYNTTLTHQVAQHQHANQRGRIRQQQRDQNGYNNREQNLLQLGNRTELLHHNRALLLGSQSLHNRRLNNRHQGHVRISCNSDWS